MVITGVLYVNLINNFVKFKLYDLSFVTLIVDSG